MNEIKQTLKINQFEVWVHLGCSDEERKHTQPVHFTLQIKFIKNLTGSQTDQLADAVDYVQLTETIKSVAMSKPYQLIEHLNQQVFNALIKDLKIKNTTAEIELTIRKIRVPVENLTNGVEFTCQQMLL